MKQPEEVRPQDPAELLMEATITVAATGKSAPVTLTVPARLHSLMKGGKGPEERQDQ
ncbi:MAG: hypothetical protein PHE68_04520 [Candidatus Peribacteraceae bacterium]|nr:hypothetical protein [Candidatus Peribacteraceae bacterium]MDD5074552.1 hypothetical protein [Candidatus Peribacteraceae bacterium]